MSLPSLLLLASLAAAPTPATLELPESGALGWGMSLEFPVLGPSFALAPGDTSTGFSLAGALQFDLGPRWALRLPLDLGGGTEELGRDRFATLGFTPGLLRRWRTSADDAWVPYVGAGLRMGVLVAGRNVLDVPLAPGTAATRGVAALARTRAADLDWDDGGDADDENVEGRAGLAPELWAGGEWHPARWFSLNLGAAYFPWRTYGRWVHVVSPRVGVRFSL